MVPACTDSGPFVFGERSQQHGDRSADGRLHLPVVVEALETGAPGDLMYLDSVNPPPRAGPSWRDRPVRMGRCAWTGHRTELRGGSGEGAEQRVPLRQSEGTVGEATAWTRRRANAAESLREVSGRSINPKGGAPVDAGIGKVDALGVIVLYSTFVSPRASAPRRAAARPRLPTDHANSGIRPGTTRPAARKPVSSGAAVSSGLSRRLRVHGSTIHSDRGRRASKSRCGAAPGGTTLFAVSRPGSMLS